MGFLSRRLKGKRRRLVPRDRSNDSSPMEAVNPIFRLLRVVGFLVFYIIWSSLTFPRSSGWRADLRLAILTQMGRNPVEGNTKPTTVLQDATTPFKSGGDNEELPGIPIVKEYQQHRIPCGLILVNGGTVPATASEDDEDFVLPLPTTAIVPVDDTTRTKTITSDSEVPSTLHARALANYPRLQHHVVAVPQSSRDDTTTKEFKRMIPPNTFWLRMGSEESTIEDSPPLWIIEDDSNSGGNTDADLVLGTSFWKNHGAEFGSDEVFLYPTLSDVDGEVERKGPRVMVPYLRMRSRPSFGMEEL